MDNSAVKSVFSITVLQQKKLPTLEDHLTPKLLKQIKIESDHGDEEGDLKDCDHRRFPSGWERTACGKHEEERDASRDAERSSSNPSRAGPSGELADIAQPKARQQRRRLPDGEMTRDASRTDDCPSNQRRALVKSEFGRITQNRWPLVKSEELATNQSRHGGLKVEEGANNQNRRLGRVEENQANQNHWNLKDELKQKWHLNNGTGELGDWLRLKVREGAEPPRGPSPLGWSRAAPMAPACARDRKSVV